MTQPPPPGDQADPTVPQPGGWTDPYAPTQGEPQPGTAAQSAPAQGVPAPPAYPAYAYSTPAGPPGYPPPYGYPLAQPVTNGLAIAAMVCALAGVATGISAPVGAILGHIARKQIRERGEQGDGMALTGIIAGWVLTGLYLICCVGYIGVIGFAISQDPNTF